MSSKKFVGSDCDIFVWAFDCSDCQKCLRICFPFASRWQNILSICFDYAMIDYVILQIRPECVMNLIFYAYLILKLTLGPYQIQVLVNTIMQKGTHLRSLDTTS